MQTSTGLQITRIRVSPYRANNANFRNFWASYRHGTMFAPKQHLYLKEDLGMQSPKMLVQKGYQPLRGFKLPGFMYHHIGPTMQLPKFRGFLSAWYRVCTKAIFISKGSFRDAESKNNNLELVQKGYKLLLGFKLPSLMYRHIGPTM